MDVLGGLVIAARKRLHHFVQFLADHVGDRGDGAVAAEAQGAEGQRVFAAQHVELLAHLARD